LPSSIFRESRVGTAIGPGDLGTSVMGGMIAVVILAQVMAPVFFVAARWPGIARMLRKKPASLARGSQSGPSHSIVMPRECGTSSTPWR
jgi:hypothetical protein